MNDIEDIKELINNVSNGSIVSKTIQNKQYYYFQYYKYGKTKSIYIPSKYLDEIKDTINNKNKTNKIRKKSLKETRNLPSLSDNAKSLTGYLMSGDRVVSIYKNGELIFNDERYCPLLIKRTNNLLLFLSSRAIDSGRTNARLLKKALNIKEEEDFLISQYCYGATITDNYWFKPLYSKLKYKDISFCNDFYGDLALNGSFNLLPKYSKFTPQLTLIGSFEKCWKKENDGWWLYKKGNKDNIFSELFVYELCKKLNINTAIYKYVDTSTIKTLNFASKYNFEPIMSIAGENDTYNNVFNSLSKYSSKIKNNYLKIIWLDTLVYNVDRHNENIGLLRDKKTGKIVDLAPNFDNNLSLSGNGKKLSVNLIDDSLIKIFIDFLKNNNEALKLFKSLNLKEINKELLISCLNNIDCEYKNKDVVDFIYERYKYLNNKLKKL